MTKAEVISKIAKSTGIERAHIHAVVESFMETIKTSMGNDENIYLRGFGSFVVKQRAEKKARNISKNTTITIPARKIPGFKPAKTFIAAVQSPAKVSKAKKK